MPMADHYDREETAKVVAWLEARRRQHNESARAQVALLATSRRTLPVTPPPILRQDLALRPSPTIRQHRLSVIVQKDKGSLAAISAVILGLARKAPSGPSASVTVERDGPTKVIHVSWD